MLNLKLKIVGDPELIKQDDIYTNPSQGGYETQINTLGIMKDNGSVPMDNGEVMAKVEFRTILDMDDTKGTPSTDPKYEANSVFSGIYRMLTVDNVFQAGKFEQVVDLIRMPDAVNNATKDADKGKDRKDNESMKAKDSNASPDAREPADGTDAEEDDFNPTDVDAEGDDEELIPLNDDEEEEPDETEETDEPDEDPEYEDLHTIDEEADEVDIDDFEDTESTDPESDIVNDDDEFVDTNKTFTPPTLFA